MDAFSGFCWLVARAEFRRCKARSRFWRRWSGTLVTVVMGLLGTHLDSANASGQRPAMQNTPSNRADAEPARTTPLARDPKIAVAEEFELVRKLGTADAL